MAHSRVFHRRVVPKTRKGWKTRKIIEKEKKKKTNCVTEANISNQPCDQRSPVQPEACVLWWHTHTEKQTDIHGASMTEEERDLQWFHISDQLILAPRPPMHFLHKTFPGTIDKISHCAKLHSSSCLVSWLPKISSWSLAYWELTFFSQNWDFLNISFTVHILYTWLTHPKQLCGMPCMSLAVSGVPGKEETTKLTYVKQNNVALPLAQRADSIKTEKRVTK